mmetsp:Transcript_27048/g.70758  ORF Transcript_27048/g.70758 Transcript_27048/m.70758 type:complete len:241 (-) Transcript_27048:325-1047(-)
MFQPIGPNLRRSWQIAWKKQNPKTSREKASGFSQSFSIRSSHLDMEPSTLARRPFGGSLVILTPFCRRSGGNCGVGMEVSHRRYMLSVSSAFCCSQIRSSSGSQEIERWQLQSRTQPPLSRARSIIFWALGPWPCPREMLSSFCPMPLASANWSMSATGSLPAERTKISGDIFVESSNDTAMSKVGGSTNFCPMSLVTKSSTAVVTRSRRRVRKKQIFWNGLNFSSQGPGNVSLSASGSS